MLQRSQPTWLTRAAAADLVVFACAASTGLIAAYFASRTTGIPLLAPDPEAVDAVGLASVAVELLGLGFAVWIARPIGRQHRRPFLQEVTR